MYDIRLANYYRKNYKIVVLKTDEIFRDILIPGCEGYKVSNYGRVYSVDSDIIVTPFITRYGYAECKIHEVNKQIHRLVLQTFEPISNPENYDVNHKNGNKHDNILSNLEWATRSENLYHAFRTGLARQGEKHPNSIYSNDMIETICQCLAANMDTKSICEKVGLDFDRSSQNLMYKIRKGVAWKSISSKYLIGKVS